jgi:hypothetical protein
MLDQIKQRAFEDCGADLLQNCGGRKPGSRVAVERMQEYLTGKINVSETDNHVGA